ncbi:MAG: hypothetical protein ACOCWE_00600 [Bacillota bacterium]
MNLLNKNSFLENEKADSQPDPKRNESDISLFQKAFLFTNNQML